MAARALSRNGEIMNGRIREHREPTTLSRREALERLKYVPSFRRLEGLLVYILRAEGRSMGSVKLAERIKQYASRLSGRYADVRFSLGYYRGYSDLLRSLNSQGRIVIDDGWWPKQVRLPKKRYTEESEPLPRYFAALLNDKKPAQVHKKPVHRTARP